MSGLSTRFPRWIFGAAVAISLAYVPSLTTPFDFIDDGNLVYPAPPGTTLRGHIETWWSDVVANVNHLGPFRPTLWAHWHLQANLFGADPFLWRLYRLVWVALAAGMLLWLLRELRVPAPTAIFATAAAMWNPYRGEIWTSLTLSEGVAMPYAIFALVAARRGATANRPWMWDLAGMACALVALGCKNTFAAIVPAQIVLRMWPDGLALREAIRQNTLRCVLLSFSLALPVVHFIYFKLNWHAGQYQPPGPNFAQLGRMLSGLKGAMGMDFLGAGIAAAVACSARGFAVLREYRAALLCGAVLTAAGIVVYLPMDMMSGRYTLPAAWGLDILFALLLTAVLRTSIGWRRTATWVVLIVGLIAVLCACVHRQEKFQARARMLWDVVHHIETTAPPNATIAWKTGDTARGELGVEEGIHMQWHLARRGRSDVRIALLDSDEQPVSRVELAPADGKALFRIVAGEGKDRQGWETDRSFSVKYQFGRKRFGCHVSRLDVASVRAPGGNDR